MDDWQALRVAADATHHLVASGVPAYEVRFDRVLPFHAPGLAPVRRGVEAWHVRADGTAAYLSRFRSAFGFYCGLASVEDDGGCMHINEHGRALYSDRYAWTGNYQSDRVTVRRSDGRYLHLDIEGAPVGSRTWTYAGDFREGAAVVQNDEGLHGHVLADGNALHDHWFFDLDVFHKGHARAKDRGGWMHVDRHGVPLYEERFALVEPFYNGQARAARFDGAIDVINERGESILVVRGPSRRFAAP